MKERWKALARVEKSESLHISLRIQIYSCENYIGTCLFQLSSFTKTYYCTLRVLSAILTAIFPFFRYRFKCYQYQFLGKQKLPLRVSPFPRII
jgi:hypothetical protein